MTTPRSSTATLIKALEILSRDIQPEDGVANAAILEASQRLREMAVAGDKLAGAIGCGCDYGASGPCKDCAGNVDDWDAVSR